VDPRHALGVASGELRELAYQLTAASGTRPTQLSLLLSLAAPDVVVETTVTHLDDEGDVWRTLAVHGRPEGIAAAKRTFKDYRPPFLVEKEVLGETARRLILWYKYRPELIPGTSHTRLAFRLLGRDTVLTDHARAGTLTIRILARSGRAMQEFVREAKRAAAPLGFRLLYLGPVRESRYTQLTAAEEETLRAARELGYYDVPRRAGVRAVAKAVGLSASAAGYRLRRAESKIVGAHLDA
jgi:hypothetical protein